MAHPPPLEMKPAYTESQIAESEERYAAWSARVKKISHEEILTFGFRDFKRSEFSGPGYIPDIPFGDDQKMLYVELWYYLQNRPVRNCWIFSVSYGAISFPPQYTRGGLSPVRKPVWIKGVSSLRLTVTIQR